MVTKFNSTLGYQPLEEDANKFMKIITTILTVYIYDI